MKFFARLTDKGDKKIMEKHFSACEIVEMAMRIEKNGREFYLTLAESAANTETADVFKYLAAEEDKHVGVFRGMFKSVCEYVPKEVYPEEYFSYMSALAAEYIFTRENTGKKSAENIKDYHDGINLGITFEKDSILFYEGMRRIVPAKDRALIDGLISEEKKHLAKLLELKENEAGEGI